MEGKQIGKHTHTTRVGEDGRPEARRAAHAPVSMTLVCARVRGGSPGSPYLLREKSPEGYMIA